ncbi:hypothetical protein [Herbiconiux sp. VKM Ac-2851]|uniref:hypothetical protein n=1 Tax=Herbiconiux sp. VKM Ac-2851 TaxID=2739025 RepID=UPI001564A01C|nr:hypothetical protein [Herbiconiux sp. VKM Ac-2851]NQX35133.1 hypothetical protein [Herbiconiux sp. VKM Ac-2851]
MFRRQEVAAEATIVLVHIRRVSSDGLTPTREWAADVRMPDGALRRTRIAEPRWVIDFWPPDAGAVVGVLVHEPTGRARFDMRDRRLSARGRKKLASEAFAAALREQAGRGFS